MKIPMPRSPLSPKAHERPNTTQVSVTVPMETRMLAAHRLSAASGRPICKAQRGENHSTAALGISLLMAGFLGDHVKTSSFQEAPSYLPPSSEATALPGRGTASPLSGFSGFWIHNRAQRPSSPRLARSPGRRARPASSRTPPPWLRECCTSSRTHLELSAMLPC